MIVGTATLLTTPLGMLYDSFLDEILVANSQNVLRFSRPLSGTVNLAPLGSLY
jgi:hypothetical protein